MGYLIAHVIVPRFSAGAGIVAAGSAESAGSAFRRSRGNGNDCGCIRTVAGYGAQSLCMFGCILSGNGIQLSLQPGNRFSYIGLHTAGTVCCIPKLAVLLAGGRNCSGFSYSTDICV